MAKINVLPADTYILVSKSNLNDFHRKILINLYEPIIGTIATNLYFNFWSQLERKKEEYNHYYLVANMGINLDLIIEAKEKLEAIGLIKTYINKKEQSIKKFIYEVYSPLEPYEFLSSPLLNTLLMNNIGEDEYKKIETLFAQDKQNLDDYQDITCTFSEIFKVECDTTIDSSNIKKSLKNKIILESNIDIDNIISLIPDEMLNKKSITKELINTINNLSFVYNLNEEDLKEIIINSINVEHKIDKEKLKITSRNYYEFNHGSKKTNLLYKKQPENLKENNTTNKMVYTFENTSPYDFLKSKYNNANPTKTDLKIVEYLLENLKFPSGVVNVLIDYVLKTNDNKLTKSYIETIAGQWKRNNINTVIEAMTLAKKEYKARKNIKNKIEKNIEVTPKWVNKNIKSEIATKEEQEQISQMLKELVGE